MRRSLILLLGASACFSEAEIVGPEPGAQTSTTDSTVGAATGDGSEEGAGTSTSGAASTTGSTGSDSETGGTAVGTSSADSTDSTDSTDTGSDPCHGLRTLEPGTPQFDVVTDPIVTGAAIKFTASDFSATDVGIVIVAPSNPDAFVAQQTVCAMGFAPLTTYQATHCGVPTAGQYCAFLTSMDGNLYHAVLTIDVVDGNASDCPNALSSCPEIEPWSGEACLCP